MTVSVGKRPNDRKTVKCVATGSLNLDLFSVCVQNGESLVLQEASDTALVLQVIKKD